MTKIILSLVLSASLALGAVYPGGGSGGADSSAVDALSESLEVLAGNDFVLGGATNANVVGLARPYIEGPPIKRSDSYEGGVISVDLDAAADFTFVVTNETIEIAYTDAPDTTGTAASWSGIITNAFTNTATVQWGAASPTSLVPVTTLNTNDVYEFKLESRDNVLRYTYIGPQSEVLPPDLGGSGVTTGVAPDGKDVLGDWSITETTNYFPDLASGTVFRFPNTLNPYLKAPASRLSASDTNGLVITRRVEMLPAAAERIIGVDTNYYALSGLGQFTTNPAGVPFTATLINWGPDSSNNIVFASLSTNIASAGGGGGGTDYTLNLVEYWGMQDASGNLTGENGYHLTSTGGTLTYRAAGLVEPYSVTNTGDSSLTHTNPSPALQFDGTDTFTVAGWVHLANAATDFRYVVSRYDSTLADRVFALRTSGGNWQILVGTNASGATTLASTGIAAVTGSNYVALVYDGTIPEIKFSANGSSFASYTLNAPLLSEPVAFAIGGVLDNGAASGSRTAGYEQWALWSDAKPLSFIQDLYNGGTGKPRSEWEP